MKLTGKQIQEAIASSTPLIRPEKVWQEIGTDTRLDLTEQLFVALKGENFDAHDYIEQALKQGAKGLLVHQDMNTRLSDLNAQGIEVFEVKDTLVALQKLAELQAKQWGACVKVAITGTSGKTTTKYLAHQILQDLIPHYFSPKSFNNHIGVPLSLMEVEEQDQLALLEVGMNHPGEIAALTKIIDPDVCLVTMVGRGHLEGMGSVEKVLKEKMSIYQYGKSHIINLDDQPVVQNYKSQFAHLDVAKVWVSAKDEDADVFLEVIDENFESFTVKGHIGGVRGKARVPLMGTHNVYNVLMAVAIAMHTELPIPQIWQRLETLTPFWGRGEVKSAHGLNFYFDAYNANPESMLAFLKQLQKLKEPPYIILGEMLELGESTKALHYELGQKVAQVPHKKVWFMGPSQDDFLKGYESRSKQNSLIISDTYSEELALKYKSMLKTGDWIALKGSRGMRLENFLTLFEGVKLH